MKNGNIQHVCFVDDEPKVRQVIGDKIRIFPYRQASGEGVEFPVAEVGSEEVHALACGLWDFMLS